MVVETLFLKVFVHKNSLKVKNIITYFNMYYIAKNQKKRLQKLYIINKFFFIFLIENALELLYIMEGVFLGHGHLRACS